MRFSGGIREQHVDRNILAVRGERILAVREEDVFCSLGEKVLGIYWTERGNVFGGCSKEEGHIFLVTNKEGRYLGEEAIFLGRYSEEERKSAGQRG